MRSMGKKSTQNKSWHRSRNTLPMMLWKNLMRLREKPLHMDEFIKQCETFDSITCQSLIDIFEESENKERIENFGRPNFTQVNLSQEKKYRKFAQILSYKFIEVFRSYKEGLEDYAEWFPHKIFMEELRIKKYEPDSDDMFDLHVDVQDHAQQKDILLFFVISMMIFLVEKQIFLTTN